MEKENNFTPSARLKMYQEEKIEFLELYKKIEQEEKNNCPALSTGLSVSSFILLQQIDSILKYIEELERAQK